MGDATIGARARIYCNKCKNTTNHEVRVVLAGPQAEAVDDILEPSWYYWEKTEYSLWFCLGCDTATLEEAFTCST